MLQADGGVQCLLEYISDIIYDPTVYSCKYIYPPFSFPWFLSILIFLTYSTVIAHTNWQYIFKLNSLFIIDRTITDDLI